VKESDVEALMAGLMKKAQAGDVAAAKLVLGYLTGGGAPKARSEKRRRKPRPEPTSRLVEAEPALTVRSVAVETAAVKQLRKLIGLYLIQNGAARTNELVRVLEIGADELEALLNHEWFGQARGEWSLTPGGRNAVG
jgi:hypothetical protein